MNSKVAVQRSAKISGSVYRSPTGAARAWARAVARAMERRHAKKIDMAAYHDPEWEKRNGRDPKNDIVAGPLVLNVQPTKLEAKAFRRALPIFRRLFASGGAP